MRRYFTRLLTLAAAVLLSTAAHAEEITSMKELPFELTKSYKQTSEHNPLYTQRFGADPGVMTWNGRVYVYMTDDIIEKNTVGQVKENSYSLIRTINVISSDDMVNWTDHGRIAVAGTFGAAKWAGNSWAPCAAHKTIDGQEKFFLYYCNGGNGIGVLTADSPTGPWSDPLGHALITRSVPNCADIVWLFDPAVMVDDDGTGYLAFGGGIPDGQQAAPGTARIVRLGEDMISLACDPVTIDAPYLFEDSGINKINGKYVYTYCSNFQTDGNTLGLSGGAIQYMLADDPLGPYTYQGELFLNPGRFFGSYGNNHHSICELNGEYYLFYHSRPVEKAMGISGNYRSPQVNAITVNANATMLPVTGTMRGVKQLKNVDPYAGVCASTLCVQAGMSVTGCGEALSVRDIDQGDWTMVAGVDFGEGCSALTLRIGSGSGCTVYVSNSRTGDILARAEIPADTPESTEITVPMTVSGVQDVYFVFDGSAVFESWRAER